MTYKKASAIFIMGGAQSARNFKITIESAVSAALNHFPQDFPRENTSARPMLLLPSLFQANGKQNAGKLPLNNALFSPSGRRIVSGINRQKSKALNILLNNNYKQ